METTSTSSSRVGAQPAEAPDATAPQPEPAAPPADATAPVPAARRAAEGYLKAAFPWYGLDGAFTGPRWLMQVGTGADGTVEHGSTGHGDEPSVRGEIATGEKERFAVVVTVASNPLRRSGDGTGVLEATSVSSAAVSYDVYKSRRKRRGSSPTTSRGRTGRRCRCRWTGSRRPSTTASRSSGGCWPGPPGAGCTWGRTGGG